MPFFRRQRCASSAACSRLQPRTLAAPKPIKDWPLTSLKEKLIKGGAKVATLESMKAELVHQVRYPTRDATQRDLFTYIEGYYSRQRLHFRPRVHYPRTGRANKAVIYLATSHVELLIVHA